MQPWNNPYTAAAIPAERSELLVTYFAQVVILEAHYSKKMRTKLRMPLFTMESYLATEASVFLRAKYEDVPKQMLGSVFYMSRFVENLLGKQEENFTQQHAAAQFNELLRHFPNDRRFA